MAQWLRVYTLCFWWTPVPMCSGSQSYLAPFLGTWHLRSSEAPALRCTYPAPQMHMIKEIKSSKSHARWHSVFMFA